MMENQATERRWLGWAIDRPGHPLFVQSCGDEEGAWDIALGWPSAEEIAAAKAAGARAFPIEIRAALTSIMRERAVMTDKDAAAAIRRKLTEVIARLLDSADLLQKADAGGDTGFALAQALTYATKARDLIGLPDRPRV